jgi:hypothetical protein
LHRAGDEEEHAGDEAVGDHAEDGGVEAEVGERGDASMTKPMWATDENAMSRFMSVWARQPRRRR